MTVLMKCLYQNKIMLNLIESVRAFFPMGQSKLSVIMRCIEQVS